MKGFVFWGIAAGGTCGLLFLAAASPSWNGAALGLVLAGMMALSALAVSE